MRKEELSPLLICQVGTWAGNRCHPMPRPSTPEAGERACPGVIKAGEQYLMLISCSARKSGLCTVPGQHSRTGPEGIDRCGGTDPAKTKAGELAQSFIEHCKR